MKNFLPFFILGFFCISCHDELEDAEKSPNILSAQIDSLSWVSSSVYTQRSLQEDGPLIVVGTGDGYTIEIVLGGIKSEGEYEMGTNRTGKIKFGNYTYSTLDVEKAGKIFISSYSENRIIGHFFFDAQWLSANNRMQVSAGEFDISYY